MGQEQGGSHMTNLSPSALIDKHFPRPAYVHRLDSMTAKRLREQEEARRKEAERLEKLKQQRLARKNGTKEAEPKGQGNGDVENRCFELKAGKSITISDIKLVVAEEATVLGKIKVTVSHFESPLRMRKVARPRQVAMYLAKHQLGLSLPQIGRKFGNRDHTTVGHAVKKIIELRIIEDEYTVDILKKSCERLGIEVPSLPKKEELPPS